MEQLRECFQVVLEKDGLSAELDCLDRGMYKELKMDEELLNSLMKENQIHYGLNQTYFHHLIAKEDLSFPITIAKGKPAINGIDGEIVYHSNFTTEIDRDSNANFRDIMRIPAATTGQKLATLKPPTNEEDGINVFNKKIRANPGKAALLNPGKNVVFHQEDQSFYAEAEGQLSIMDNTLHVYPVYEVHETLSMKYGNLDFVGNIIIHGDVPSGFSVKATADIKIYGLVEAATIIAGGTVYIAEGLAGQKEGSVVAGETVRVGYINQGSVVAGKDIFVENSILHSTCAAGEKVYCQKGNIIGGSVSAGKSVEAMDVGNRLHIKTEISLGINKLAMEKEQVLVTKKKELEEEIAKLSILGKRMENTSLTTSEAKLRITKLRQRNLYEKACNELATVTENLKMVKVTLGNQQTASITVRQNLYRNVLIAFGKYKKAIKSGSHYVRLEMNKNEIVTHPLFS
ncbi:DUF342 domain-containing protein [Oceanobacillus picturae]|uniref:DUF342 domain-containing protein n=1 Tax=Oceanobacillus picturae TaxID=171693 RepID=UPI00363FD201